MRAGRFCVALALTGLAGCAGVSPFTGEFERESAQAAAVMDYLRRSAHLDEAARRSELARAKEACRNDVASLDCLRLGGLHAQPVAGLRDDARALALLALQTGDGASPPAASLAPRPLADLASLLLLQVEERQRAAASGRKVQADLRSRYDALRERLKAVNAMERGIIEREERVQERARPPRN